MTYKVLHSDATQSVVDTKHTHTKQPTCTQERRKRTLFHVTQTNLIENIPKSEMNRIPKAIPNFLINKLAGMYMCICKVQIVSHCVESLFLLVQKNILQEIRNAPKMKHSPLQSITVGHCALPSSNIHFFFPFAHSLCVLSFLTRLLCSVQACFFLYPMHLVCLACYAMPWLGLARLGSAWVATIRCIYLTTCS